MINFTIKVFFHLIVLIFLITTLVPIQAQDIQIDSLEKRLSSYKGNSIERINTLNQLSEEIRFRSTQLSLMYAQQGLMLSEQMNYQRGLGDAFNNIGTAFYDLNSFDKALFYYDQSLSIYKTMQKKDLLAKTYKNIGNIYFSLGEYQKALEYNMQSYEIYNSIQDKKGKATARTNIGAVYFQMNFYDKALSHFQNALESYEALEDERGMAVNLHNIGEVYEQLGQYNKALIYYQKGLKLDKKVGFDTDIAESLIAIGGLYTKVGNTKQALIFYDKAYKIQRKTQNQKGMSMALAGTAEVYLQRGQLDLAYEYFLQSVELAQSIRVKELLKEGYQKLAEVSEKQGEFKRAYRYHKLFKIYQDSLYNQERLEQITAMQAKFDLKEKEEEITTLNQQTAQDEQTLIEQEDSISFQRSILVFLLTGAIVLAAFVWMFYREKNQKEKVNKALKLRNDKIESQKTEIEEKSTNLQQAYNQITASIRYAQALQNAFLPQKHILDNLLKEHFIIYRPKDIVSGDFYWVKQVEEKTFIAVMDCTGHGVAGAMMSMIGNTLLNEIIIHKRIFSPAQILKELHKGLSEISHTKIMDIDLGMEACLCKIEPSAQEPNMQLTFAGAKRPLFLIQHGEMTELKGDRYHLGLTDNEKHFENRCLETYPGTMIYLSSDGYIDQANPDRKRFGSRKLKKILRSEFNEKTMEEQKQILEKLLESHQKDANQRDDITILGVLL